MVFRCLILSDTQSREPLQEGLTLFAQETGYHVDVQWFNETSQLLYRLRDGPPSDVVIVALPGAAGMEGVIGVREHRNYIPLIWCTEDAGFALTSYRYHCTQFLLYPLEPYQIAQAVGDCLPYGTRINCLTQKEEVL